MRWELSNGWGHASSKEPEHDRLFFFLLVIVFAERLGEALGENLFSIAGSSWIHRPRFGVVHPCLSEFPAQMGWMVRDVVAVFDKRVNLLRRPRLALFETGAEFVPLLRGELRQPTAAEAWAESLI